MCPPLTETYAVPQSSISSECHLHTSYRLSHNLIFTCISIGTVTCQAGTELLVSHAITLPSSVPPSTNPPGVMEAARAQTPDSDSEHSVSGKHELLLQGCRPSASLRAQHICCQRVICLTVCSLAVLLATMNVLLLASELFAFSWLLPR